MRCDLGRLLSCGDCCSCGCGQRSAADDEARNEAAMPKYPETRRVDQVDDYHGAKVADPYRWLEADVRESPEVADWVAKQNEVARAYLDAIPAAAADRAPAHRALELRALLAADRRRPASTSISRTTACRIRPCSTSPTRTTAKAACCSIPNKWSKDGTVALADYAPSDDGKLLAYARSEAGSDWQQIYVVDVATGKQLPDHLKWARFSDIAWAKDGSGFYYSRYPEPAPGEQYQSVATNQMIYFHKLGDEQADDTLIYRRPGQPGLELRPRADRRRQVPGARDLPQHRSAEPGARARSLRRRPTPRGPS